LEIEEAIGLIHKIEDWNKPMSAPQMMGSPQKYRHDLAWGCRIGPARLSRPCAGNDRWLRWTASRIWKRLNSAFAELTILSAPLHSMPSVFYDKRQNPALS
jgi:hypothetical protein